MSGGASWASGPLRYSSPAWMAATVARRPTSGRDSDPEAHRICQPCLTCGPRSPRSRERMQSGVLYSSRSENARSKSVPPQSSSAARCSSGVAGDPVARRYPNSPRPASRLAIGKAIINALSCSQSNGRASAEA